MNREEMVEAIAQQVEAMCKPCDLDEYNCCVTFCEFACCGTEHELGCNHAEIAAAIRAGAR